MFSLFVSSFPGGRRASPICFAKVTQSAAYITENVRGCTLHKKCPAETISSNPRVWQVSTSDAALQRGPSPGGPRPAALRSWAEVAAAVPAAAVPEAVPAQPAAVPDEAAPAVPAAAPFLPAGKAEPKVEPVQNLANAKCSSVRVGWRESTCVRVRLGVQRGLLRNGSQN